MNKENEIIWRKLEKLGWCTKPTGIELDFFEDVVKMTKEALNYTHSCETFTCDVCYKETSNKKDNEGYRYCESCNKL